MLNSEVVADWLDEAVDTLDFDEEPVPPEGIESLDPAECDELLARLAVIARAVRFLQDAGKRRLVDHIGQRGWVRFGDRTYRARPKRTWKVKPDQIGAFFDLLDAAGLARRAFNPNDAREGGIDALAEVYVDPETGEVGSREAFEARFLDVSTGDIEVTPTPAANAPKFIAGSPDGEPQYRGDVA